MYEDTQPGIRAIGVSHKACKDRLVSTKSSISQLDGVYFYFCTNNLKTASNRTLP